MGNELWFPLSTFLAGIVAAGIGMLIREDTMGRKYAEEAKNVSKENDARIESELDMAERRLNDRIDREMSVIGRQLEEIKDSLVRLEARP